MAFWNGSTSIVNINTSTPNSGTGDTLFDAFVKVDSNFANISTFLSAVSGSVDFSSANIAAANIIVSGGLYSPVVFSSGNITASGINTTGPSNLNNTWVTQLATTGTLYANSGIVTTGSIIPTANVAYDLGSPNNYFRNIYIQGAVAVSTVQSSSNASLLVTNANVLPGDVKDTGILSKYNQNSSNAYAFFGFQHSTGNFVYKKTSVDASLGSGIVSDGVYGNVQFGSLFLSNTTTSTSSTTGALQVAGGLGVAGNVNAGGTVTASVVNANLVSTVANISRATVANIAGNVWVDGVINSNGSPVVTVNSIASIIAGVNNNLNNTTVLSGSVISFIGGTPSTSVGSGTIVVTNGGGIGVSGNVTAGGLYGPYYGLIQTANQTNITGLGTLAAINVSGTGTFNSVQATSLGTVSLTATGSVNASGGFAGTMLTANQPNITGLGTLNNLTVSGTATVGRIITTNGIFWANGSGYTPGVVSSYGNLDVITFLPTYSGNVTNLGVTGLLTTYGNIVTTNGIYWANGSAYSTGNVINTYSNANVASYLPTYSGNIKAGNITVANGIFWSNGASYSSGVAGSYSNTDVANYLASRTDATINSISANVSAANVSIASVVSNVSSLSSNVTAVTANLNAVTANLNTVATNLNTVTANTGSLYNSIIGANSTISTLSSLNANNVLQITNLIQGQTAANAAISAISATSRYGDSNVTALLSGGFGSYPITTNGNISAGNMFNGSVYTSRGVFYQSNNVNILDSLSSSQITAALRYTPLQQSDLSTASVNYASSAGSASTAGSASSATLATYAYNAGNAAYVLQPDQTNIFQLGALWQLNLQSLNVGHGSPGIFWSNGVNYSSTLTISGSQPNVTAVGTLNNLVLNSNPTGVQPGIFWSNGASYSGASGGLNSSTLAAALQTYTGQINGNYPVTSPVGRTIYTSPSAPQAGQGKNGDIWIQTTY